MISSQMSKKVSLENFEEGDVALFFPMPAAPGKPKQYMAFTLKRCRVRYLLSEESKMLIGHSTHFKE